MSKFWKYLIYILIGVFAFSWFKVVLDAGKTRDQGITENVESIKDRAGRVVGDLMEDNDEENDNDIGDGEDDLDADELDEDEILAEDWDEEDETEEDEMEEEEDVAEVETTAKGAAKDYDTSSDKAPAKSATVVTTSSNGRFLVIGGSFSSKGNANTFVKQLGKLGYEDAEIVVFDKAKKYHTVSVARFDSKTDASKLVGALRGKGIKDAYVHKKRG